MNWQPIETAPKDGRWIWLCGGTTTERATGGDTVLATRPVSAFWDGVHPDFGYWMFCYWDCGWRSHYENPTHWAELELPK